MDNLFDIIDKPLTQELVDILAESSSVRIERIVSAGQTSDWYDQCESEFVCLLQGRARILFADGRTLELKKGDTLQIAAHERHKVIYTSSRPVCVWLCIFYQ